MDPMLRPDHLAGARSLFTRMKNQRADDGVSRMLTGWLAADTTQLVADYPLDTAPSQPLVKAMARDLNLVLRGPSIWDPATFAGVVLSPRSRKRNGVLSRIGRDHRELNRCLLEDAYPLRDPVTGVQLPGIAIARNSWSEDWEVFLDFVRTQGRSARWRSFYQDITGKIEEQGLIDLMRQIEKDADALAEEPDGDSPVRAAWVAKLRSARDIAISLVLQFDQRRAVAGLDGATLLYGYFNRLIDDLNRTIDAAT